jgi:nucleotide-binding universal stress UspA family protein
MRILVATDGSEYSKAAIKKCCDMIVDPQKTHVKVISAYEDAYPIAPEPFAISSEFYQEIINAAENQSEEFVSQAADSIRKQFKENALDVSSDILRGSPEQQIVEEAKKWKADLIVVGCHGRGFWGRMLGSVSDAVVHHAPCSVLVVRNGHENN